jgi:hypothetical protein
MKKLLCLFVLSFSLAACAPLVPTAADSGIQGQVLIGPLCPVMQSGVPCPDRPYQATLSVLTPAGIRILRFQTDPAGHFRINLNPGQYVLHPETANAFPHAPEQPFIVSPGRYTQLTVTYDSGIR